MLKDVLYLFNAINLKIKVSTSVLFSVITKLSEENGPDFVL